MNYFNRLRNVSITITYCSSSQSTKPINELMNHCFSTLPSCCLPFHKHINTASRKTPFYMSSFSNYNNKRIIMWLAMCKPWASNSATSTYSKDLVSKYIFKHAPPHYTTVFGFYTTSRRKTITKTKFVRDLF